MTKLLGENQKPWIDKAREMKKKYEESEKVCWDIHIT